MLNTAPTTVSTRRAVRALASAAQVAVGTATLEPASRVRAFLRVGRYISETSSIREVLVVRSLLATLVCRLALHVQARVLSQELQNLLSRLDSAESGRELRLAYETCIVAIATDTDGFGSHFSIADRRVTFGVRYIRDHCTDRTLSLRHVATQVNLSPWHFDRLLKRSTGCAYREQLRSARMSMSEYLLDETFLSMKEIAARVGYAKASDFDREFRQSHRMTPTEWRRRQR